MAKQAWHTAVNRKTAGSSPAFPAICYFTGRLTIGRQALNLIMEVQVLPREPEMIFEMLISRRASGAPFDSKACVPNMDSDKVRYQTMVSSMVEHRTQDTAVAGSSPAPQTDRKSVPIAECDPQNQPEGD